MRKLFVIPVIAVLLIVSAQEASALQTFTGSISTPSGIFATQPWMSEGMVLTWTVTENADMSWTYEYSFANNAGSDPSKDISHLIIEISPGATASSFYNANHDFEVGTYGPTDPGNPGIP